LELSCGEPLRIRRRRRTLAQHQRKPRTKSRWLRRWTFDPLGLDRTSTWTDTLSCWHKRRHVLHDRYFDKCHVGRRGLEYPRAHDCRVYRRATVRWIRCNRDAGRWCMDDECDGVDRSAKQCHRKSTESRSLLAL